MSFVQCLLVSVFCIVSGNEFHYMVRSLDGMF